MYYTYDGRARRAWMHKVYCTVVDCYPLTPLLRSVTDLLYNLLLYTVMLQLAKLIFDRHIVSCSFLTLRTEREKKTDQPCFSEVGKIDNVQ